MCLIDACEEMQRLAVAMELDRIKPEPPCNLCKPDELCWFHKPMHAHAPRQEPTP